MKLLFNLTTATFLFYSTLSSSWIGPVTALYKPTDIESIRISRYKLSEFIVEIQPIVAGDNPCDAQWDYIITEKIKLVQLDSSPANLMLYLDGGDHVDEKCSLIYCFLNNEKEIQLKEMIAYPIYTSIDISENLNDDYILIRKDGWIYGLKSLENHKKYTEEHSLDFHEVIPETRCFYSDLIIIPESNNDFYEIELKYWIRGYSHLVGITQLKYSFFLPGSWESTIDIGEISLDLSEVNITEGWSFERCSNSDTIDLSESIQWKFHALDPSNEPFSIIITPPGFSK